MGEMARYRELNGVFADKLNITGRHETAGKSSVLRRCVKIVSDGAEATVDGRLFHAGAAATVKVAVV